MYFSQSMIYTGQEKKISKNTGIEYSIVKLLDEQGNQVSCLVEKIESGLQMLQSVYVAFELKLGKYIQLKALEVKSND